MRQARAGASATTPFAATTGDATGHPVWQAFHRPPVESENQDTGLALNDPEDFTARAKTALTKTPPLPGPRPRLYVVRLQLATLKRWRREAICRMSRLPTAKRYRKLGVSPTRADARGESGLTTPICW